MQSPPRPLLELLVLPLLWGAVGCEATSMTHETPSTPAHALLERSLRHHDPDGVWGEDAIPIRWESTRPDGTKGFVGEMTLGPGGDFSMRGERAGHQLDYRVEGDVVTATVDGESEVADELRQKLLLARDDGLFWRDYFGFLGGLPMNLLEPTVIVEPDVATTELGGREVLAVRASFDPEVGTDVWTFYFEPDSAALVGCRFDKADPAKDGETIVFEGETSAGGVLLPTKRSWTMNADGRFLGTDEILTGAP